MDLLKRAATATVTRLVHPATEKAIATVPRLRVQLVHATVEVATGRLTAALSRSYAAAHFAAPVARQVTPPTFVVRHSLKWSSVAGGAEWTVVHRAAMCEADELDPLLAIDTPYPLLPTLSLILFGCHAWPVLAALAVLPWALDTYVTTFVLAVASVAVLWSAAPKVVGSGSAKEFAARVQELMVSGRAVVEWTEACDASQAGGWIINFAFVMGVMQAVQYFKVGEGENDVIYIRAAYAFTQLAVGAILYYIKTRIDAKKDETKMVWTQTGPGGSLVEGTVAEYDQEMVQASLKQHVISLVLMSGLHLYGGYLQPLILQALMPWKALLTAPLFRIHLMGAAPEGDLARPFPIMSAFGTPKQDEAAEAYKADQGKKAKGVTGSKKEGKKNK
ncbi:phosphate transporter (Pho88) [Blastocladiella emersonii ATCC 22665]|nr:phosphate transporter (Pho88) [Blastocladiella emersonii ATCC 22665]